VCSFLHFSAQVEVYYHRSKGLCGVLNQRRSCDEAYYHTS
jgi:hypothetical protein